jgi:hypothetical protein
MSIVVSIPSEETIPTEDEVEESEASLYSEHYAETASGEKSAQKQYQMSTDY